MKDKEPFGEVAESTLSSVIIQVYNPARAVDFGEFVKLRCGEINIIGAVMASAMQPVDIVTRVPKPLKLEREQLVQTYPDLSEKMRMMQTLYVLGSVGSDGAISHRLPPRAPMIHDLAVEVEKDFVKQFHKSSRSFKVDYMSRMIEDNSIEYPIDFVSALLSNVVIVLESSEREEFLLKVLETYQKAVAPRISPRMISELVERLK